MREHLMKRLTFGTKGRRRRRMRCDSPDSSGRDWGLMQSETVFCPDPKEIVMMTRWNDVASGDFTKWWGEERERENECFFTDALFLPLKQVKIKLADCWWRCDDQDSDGLPIGSSLRIPTIIRQRRVKKELQPVVCLLEIIYNLYITRSLPPTTTKQSSIPVLTINDHLMFLTTVVLFSFCFKYEKRERERKRSYIVCQFMLGKKRHGLWSSSESSFFRKKG